MGQYIQKPKSVSFHEYLKTNGATEISADKVDEAFDKGQGVICLVDNVFFKACAFCYSKTELKEFQNPQDERPKHWFAFPSYEQAQLLVGRSS